MLRLALTPLVDAVYIFRLNNDHREGYTHGIYLRLSCFVKREFFSQLITELVN